jgi:hypothetical protein
MFVLVTAALAGGAITVVSLWSYGFFLALACAPLGASLLAFVAAILFSNIRGGSGHNRQASLGPLPVSFHSART